MQRKGSYRLTLFDNNGTTLFYVSKGNNTTLELYENHIRYDHGMLDPYIDLKECGHLCQRWTYSERDTLCCACEPKEEGMAYVICPICELR